MNIILKNGNCITVDDGATISQVAALISAGLARSAIAGRVDGQLADLSDQLHDGATLEILTTHDPEALDILRHTTAHIMAQAIKRLYPDAQLAIGPSTATGFYYDIDSPVPVTSEDLPRIEEQMRKIISEDLPLQKTVVDRAGALASMSQLGESYKVSIINELPPESVISLYRQGEFVDLCTGPHLASTGQVKYFRLTQLAGAYWRGDEKNKMLTRIYGTAFHKQADLDEYMQRLEQAKLRDHNKLGRELGYFMTEENIGQGLPLLMPKGAEVLRTLIRFVEDEERRRGYQYTRTPMMAKSDLYKISGHWSHYRDGMFVIGEDESQMIALRPMTCPFQFMIYRNGMKSYRDLPLRYNETATLFRNESSGEMHGLIRVRQFTLSDGHIICTPEQVESEFAQAVDLVYFMLDAIGMREDVTFRFSKWDPTDRTKYIDKPKEWEHTQALMQQILDHLGIDYTAADGEAAFYGPKLDVQIRNVWGKEDTIITIQVDFALAERFEMEYIAEDGTRQRPYIIHRSSIGCYERTLALMLEKYFGALPTWLAPVQVRVLSLTERTAPEVNDCVARLSSLGFRAEADVRNEKIGYKIREAQLQKIPFMVVIGDAEKAGKVLAVRNRKLGDMGAMTFEQLTELLDMLVSTRDTVKY